MHLLAIAFCLLGFYTESETGSVIPHGGSSLHGYQSAETQPAPGAGSWTITGPWGGNIKALAVSPINGDIVLAGCGFSMASDAGGVFKSTDGGATWAQGELFPVQVNYVCAAGPEAPTTFYAATRTGLHRSSDDGETWEAVPGMASAYVIGIGVHTGDPDILIAGLSSNNGIRRSEDGGVSWSEVGLGSGYMKGLGCDPQHPDTMYLAMSGTDHALYRSTDAGVSWSPLGPSGSGWGVLVAPFGTGETIIVTTSEGFYSTEDHGATWDLAVPGASYAPAVSDGSNLYAPVNTAAGVYESTDQGQTWTLNTQGIVASFWQAGSASSQGYLAGHYGGVYRTPSPGSEYTVSQDGIVNGFFHAVSCMASTNVLLAGGEHHGLWKSTDMGETWNIVLPGPGSWTIYDIAPKSDLHYSGPVRYAATAEGVYRSHDGGDSWAPAGLAGTQVSSVAFHPDDPDMAWAGTAAAGVHYTTDGGGSWTPGAGFPFALYPSIELLGDGQGNVRVLVAFQQNGEGVYYSDDNGQNYTLSPVPGSYHPDLSVRWNGGDPVAYSATDNGIYRSYDSGESWSPCPGSSGLMWAVEGSLDTSVFAGTNGTGIRWSPDEGYSWQPLSDGIENRVVWDIAYGSSPVQLFASLRGFSLAEITDDQLGIDGFDPRGSLSLVPSPNPASSSVAFMITGAGESPCIITVYSAAGRVVHSETAQPGSGATWTPAPGVPSGVYLARVHAGGLEAMARLVLLR